MAFNYDKLSKLRREVTRPNFALDRVKKELKKRPSDPFLLVWRAQAWLELSADPAPTLESLLSLCQRQTPIVDIELLSDIYRYLLEALRRSDSKNDPVLSSVGEIGLKAWQNAAKSLPTHRQRLDLWSALFVAAMKADCWEDVRFSLVQATKEGSKNRKTVYFASILANQLSANSKGDADSMAARIQKAVALKQLNEAFSSNPAAKDAIRVEDLSDLKFMAFIYRHQNMLRKLKELWSTPGPAMDQFLPRYQSEIKLHLVREAHGAARQQKTPEAWAFLKELCTEGIDDALERANTDNSNKPLEDLCTTQWLVWSGYLEATTHTEEPAEEKAQVNKIRGRFQEAVKRFSGNESRSLMLTNLNLLFYVGPPDSVEECTEYWKKYHEIDSCFKDMRRLVVRLPQQLQREFHTQIKHTADSLEPATEDHSKEESKRWLRAETSVVEFEYLMIISTLKQPEHDQLDAFVTNALKLYTIAASSESPLRARVAILVVKGYLQLSKLYPNDLKYLLQPAMFLHHILSETSLQDSRPLCLMSARLHLALGLGTIAYGHYGFCKVKEMLHDTVSWPFLTRISQTHPIDIPGYKGFSAYKELDKAIASIRRMELKIDEHLYTEMKDFRFHVAPDMLELKRKLKSSLTKNMCMIEQRRMSRLLGHLSPDPWLEEFTKLSDNQDFNAIPNMEYDESPNIRLITKDPPITPAWVLHHYLRVEIPSRLMCGEPIPPGFRDRVIQAEKELKGNDHSTSIHGSAEDDMRYNWYVAGYLAELACDAPLTPIDGLEMPPGRSFDYKSPDSMILSLQAALDGQLKSYKITRESQANFLWTEDSLKWLYGLYEFLRMLNRLCSRLQASVKAKRIPKLSGPLVNSLNAKVIEVFGYIRSTITEDIKNLEKSRDAFAKIAGSISPKDTFHAVIPNNKVQVYAKEYADSALASIKCVLQVRLD